MFGIFILPFKVDKVNTMDELSKETRKWELRAARGECGWICADCCGTFPKGMPDECQHGQQHCTDLIIRDKANSVLSNMPNR